MKKFLTNEEKIEIIEKAGFNYISGDISNCRTYDELPINAKKYIARIEELTNTKIKFIGTGAGRENIIIR